MRNPFRLGFASGAVAVLTLAMATHASTTSAMGTQAVMHAFAQTPDAGAKKKKRRRPSEIFNQFDTPPPPSSQQPTNFEIVLAGNDVTALCGSATPPCLDQPVYGPYNPFCPPSQGPTNPCYPTVTYDPTSNTTTVMYSGPTLYFNEPGYPGLVHFGLLSTAGQPGAVYGQVLSSYFSYPPSAGSRRHRMRHDSTTSTEPIVNINWSSKVATSANWAYAEVFIAVALKPGGAAVYGTWNDVPYVPKGSGQPHLTFTNYGSQPLYVVSSGIIPGQTVPTDPECLTNPGCPEDMSILSILNFAGSPPPGTPSSPFIPLQYPPAKVLNPTKPPI